MKILLLLPCLFFCVLPVVATPQIPDGLIYQGKHYHLYALPLYDLYTKDTIQYLHLVEPAPICNTACYRKYVGTWEIIGDELYLVHLASPCNDFKDTIDLKALFGEKCVTGKVKADWVTDALNASPTDATSLYYNHSLWGGVAYDKESDFYFERGKLIKVESYTNIIKRSRYRDEPALLQQLWKENATDRNKLPKLEKDIKIYVRFSANEVGKIDSVKVLKGHSPPFDEEAMRLVKLIPEWEVIYKRGKHQRMPWTIPVMFRKNE